MKWLQGLGLLKEPVVATSEPIVPASTEPTVAGPVAPPAEVSDLAAALAPEAPPSVVPPSETPADTPPPPVSETLATPDLTPLLTGLSEISAQQLELRQIFENRLRSDEIQGKALERLHDELQQYKTNFVRQSLTPLLKEVIFCHDFVLQQTDRLNQPGSENRADTAQKSLDAVRQMLVDLLFKFDVEPYRNEAGTGSPFEPRTQQCLKTLPTDQPDLDKRIAQQGACGFRAGETILRREQVMVYKYSGEPRPPADADNNQSTQ